MTASREDMEREPSVARMRDAHARLVSMMEAIRTMGYGGMPLGADTMFAFGEAAGHIAKARALLGRDIDDLKRASAGNGREAQVP